MYVYFLEWTEYMPKKVTVGFCWVFTMFASSQYVIRGIVSLAGVYFLELALSD